MPLLIGEDSRIGNNKIAHTLIPPRWIAGSCVQDDLINLAWKVRAQGMEGRERALEMLHGSEKGISATEGWLPAQEFKEQNAESVHIGTPICGMSSNALWGDGLWCPQKRPCNRQQVRVWVVALLRTLQCEELRQATSCDLHRLRRSKKNMIGPERTMDDAMTMSILQAFSNLLEDLESKAWGARIVRLELLGK
jgi:hypothetical protein